MKNKPILAILFLSLCVALPFACVQAPRAQESGSAIVYEGGAYYFMTADQASEFCTDRGMYLTRPTESGFECREIPHVVQEEHE